MKWVIIGGSGFVGSALTEHLIAAGESVTGLPAPRLSAPPTATATDLSALATVTPVIDGLADGLQGAAVAVLAAGLATPDATESSALTGANALLPAVVYHACVRAGVGRLIHLSSAAVQGRRATLDESAAVQPFSPYSRSKVLGEQVLAGCAAEGPLSAVVVRATSVQGKFRSTTRALRRIARSPLSSVAGDGSAPSAVSSVGSLCAFIIFVGRWPGALPDVVLQPWEGWSVAEVLRAAGGQEPRRLPLRWCAAALGLGRLVSRASRGRTDGHLRRLESMWFGQRIEAGWARAVDFEVPEGLAEVLREAR